MKVALWLVLVVAAALVIRDLFPKKVQVITPPRIVTVFDTVRALDTVWITKLRKQTDTLYQERVTLSLPETVFVSPRLWGLTALQVAPKIGDSTVAQGFSIEPGDSGQTLMMGWRVQWWTPGPLQALIVTPGGIRAGWGPPPKPNCGFMCSVKKYALGAAGGYAVCKL